MTETELLLTHILGCDRVDLYSGRTFLDDRQKEIFSDMQVRRRNREPLQYILGEWEFYGLKFKTDRRALIPRPETEILIEQILSILSGTPHRDVRILDIGTGSGNIAVTLAKMLPRASVMTLDCSSQASALARENAIRHGVADRVSCVVGDAFQVLSHLDKNFKFDVIVSNPPYIPTPSLKDLPAEVLREPLAALDGGEDGLKFFREIIGRSGTLLVDNGFLACEFGDGQHRALAGLLRQCGFHNAAFFEDLTSTPRVFIAQKD